MKPIPVRLAPEQLAWLDRQTLAGLSRAQAIRLCIHAAIDRADRGEPLIQQAQHHITTTGPADAN
jgi:hypothetical protein